jgi:hypothetical protein
VKIALARDIALHGSPLCTDRLARRSTQVPVPGRPV